MNNLKRIIATLLIAVMVATVMPISVFAATGDVAIDSKHFPDKIFRQYVSEEFDLDKNGVLSAAEIKKIDQVECIEMAIKSIAGVEYFTYLEYLDVYDNELTSIDVSKNTKLTLFDCGLNSLKSLDVTKNIKLEGLYCDVNELTSLDVSKNTNLIDFVCGENKLTSINVTNCPDLKTFYCSGNRISSLDVTKNLELTELGCAGNLLKTLNVTKNLKLESLDCAYNLMTKKPDISKNTLLESDSFFFDPQKTPCSAVTVKLTRVSGTTSSGTKYVGKPKLSWTPVEGAEMYEVYRSTSKTGTYSLIGTSKGSSYTNSGAAAGKTYYYKVKAIGDYMNADSAFSEPVGFTCTCDAPSVTLTRVNGKAKLTWKAVTGAKEYEVYRATSKDGTYKKLGTTTNLSYNNSGAPSGTTFYYKVKAISSASTYAHSNFSSIKTFTTSCDAPVISIALVSNKPKVTWKAVTGAKEYEVYRATSKDGTYTKLGTTTKLSYHNTGASKGKTYYYKVKAISSASSYANSAYSAVKSITAK